MKKNFVQPVVYRFIKLEHKKIHYQAPEINNSAHNQYNAHSPLHISRGKIEEHKSRLFFDSPPVPNRIPKYFFLFSVVTSLLVGYKTKQTYRQKMFLYEKDKEMYEYLVPFIQAMEDVRFTANEQRSYMINKAVADQYSPALFDHMRKRFYQEDVFVQDINYHFNDVGQPTHIQQQTVKPTSIYVHTTFQDKGLFDNREIGYSQ